MEKTGLPANSIADTQEMLEPNVINLSIFLPGTGVNAADFQPIDSNHETGKLIAVVIGLIAIIILPFVMTSKLFFTFITGKTNQVKQYI